MTESTLLKTLAAWVKVVIHQTATTSLDYTSDVVIIEYGDWKYKFSATLLYQDIQEVQKSALASFYEYKYKHTKDMQEAIAEYTKYSYISPIWPSFQEFKDEISNAKIETPKKELGPPIGNTYIRCGTREYPHKITREMREGFPGICLRCTIELNVHPEDRE